MENPPIFEPLKTMIEAAGDRHATSALAFWISAGDDDEAGALGWLHCVNSPKDRAKLVKTLREHADVLERQGPTKSGQQS